MNEHRKSLSSLSIPRIPHIPRSFPFCGFPLIIALLSMVQVVPVLGLSVPIGRDVNFPKDYDPQTAKAIRQVIQDEHFKFVGGIVSYWPPDYGTRLSYEGDEKSLTEFLVALSKLPGIDLRLVPYHGRDDELRRDSAWQLDFSQARPNELAVYLNLNAKVVNWAKVKGIPMTNDR